MRLINTSVLAIALVSLGCAQQLTGEIDYVELHGGSGGEIVNAAVLIPDEDIDPILTNRTTLLTYRPGDGRPYLVLVDDLARLYAGDLPPAGTRVIVTGSVEGVDWPMPSFGSDVRREHGDLLLRMPDALPPAVTRVREIEIPR